MKTMLDWIVFGLLAVVFGTIFSLFAVYALNKITGRQFHHEYGEVR